MILAHQDTLTPRSCCAPHTAEGSGLVLTCPAALGVVGPAWPWTLLEDTPLLRSPQAIDRVTCLHKDPPLWRGEGINAHWACWCASR